MSKGRGFEITAFSFAPIGIYRRKTLNCSTSLI